MAAYTKTPKLQFDLSTCDISVDVNKGHMHNAERPVKCYTQSKKTAAFFKHAHHPTGYHELSDKSVMHGIHQTTILNDRSGMV